MPANDALNQTEHAERHGAKEAAHALVLVVEDDEDLRRLVHRVLERQGYTVRSVPQGHALRAALHQPPRPRLLLIDAELEVRRHAWWTGIPAAYLSRPFSVEMLRATVREALRATA